MAVHGRRGRGRAGRGGSRKACNGGLMGEAEQNARSFKAFPERFGATYMADNECKGGRGGYKGSGSGAGQGRKGGRAGERGAGWRRTRAASSRPLSALVQPTWLTVGIRTTGGGGQGRGEAGKEGGRGRAGREGGGEEHTQLLVVCSGIEPHSPSTLFQSLNPLSVPQPLFMKQCFHDSQFPPRNFTLPCAPQQGVRGRCCRWFAKLV